LVAMVQLPTAQYPNIAAPEVQLLATYVGADALTVEESVSTPIEQQMNGVDNMIYMYSINTSTGQMRLSVDFAVGTDPNTDQVLTQMRYLQAEPQLPNDVRNYGVTTRKATSAPLVLFSLYSPKGTYDALFLGNYAYINLGIIPLAIASGAGAQALETQPELVAHHYTEAGLVEQAIPYWQQAGQRAIEHSAHVEAISHLTKGLELLKALPDTPERAQQELTLQTLLGSSVIAIKGFGVLEVEKGYGRARELCRQVGETPQLFTVLTGLRVFYLVREDLQTEHALAEQIMRLA
jgi:AcrB/AcrD/AcrF family protein